MAHTAIANDPLARHALPARAATSVRLRAADALDALTGRRDRLTPPRRMSGYVGRGDFRATGEEFLGHFRELGGLRAEDRVLEIGCGIGRMARVLAPRAAPARLL